MLIRNREVDSLDSSSILRSLDTDVDTGFRDIYVGLGIHLKSRATIRAVVFGGGTNEQMRKGISEIIDCYFLYEDIYFFEIIFGQAGPSTRTFTVWLSDVKRHCRALWLVKNVEASYKRQEQRCLKIPNH